MMESDAQLDLDEALRNAERTARAMIPAVRNRGGTTNLPDLEARTRDLGARIAGLADSETWPGDLEALLSRATSATEDLMHARKDLEAGHDATGVVRDAVAAVEAAIEIATIVSGRKVDPGRSK